MTDTDTNKDKTMTQKHIITGIQNGVGTIMMNRPEVHNAFDEQSIAELTTAFKKMGADASVRAVILRGNGKSFSAGGDLNWMRRVADYTFDQNVSDAMGLGELLKTIHRLPKPTLALVHGNAFGGGVGLTACCDIALAAKDTRFCLSEVRIGLIPSIIAPYVITAIGERQARRYFMTAERFDADQARHMGLVHEVVAAEGELDTAASKIIAALMDGAPGAQSLGKKLILDISGRTIDDAMIRLTATRIAEARAAPEGKEGLTAFLAKTEPGWRKKG